jgi:ABC-type branched-subunit amino acid transport system ATPase component
MFPSLTVEEHLMAVAQQGPWNVRKVYGVFPRLEERRTNFRTPDLDSSPFIVGWVGNALNFNR